MNWETYYKQRLNDPQVKAMINENCKGGLPTSNGRWTGVSGCSNFIQDPNVIPPNRSYSNCKSLTFSQIYKKYGIENGIPFCDGGIRFPDSIILLRIDQPELYRLCIQYNDMRSAIHRRLHKIGAQMKNMSEDEFTTWKDSLNATWHKDPYTGEFQLVYTEVHGNISHQGHIAVFQMLVTNGLLSLIDP